MDADALRTFDERSLSGKILHVDRDGRGLPGHPFCPDGDRPLEGLHEALREGLPQPVPLPAAPGADPGRRRRRLGHQRGARLRRAGPQLRLAVLRGPEPHARTTRSSPECKAQYASEPPSQTPPDYHYERPYEVGGAIVAGPQYTGTRYPEGWRDAWFFGDYAQGWIKAYDLVGGKPANVRTFAATGFTGVDLETTPEGDLVYVNFGDGSANSGSVRRIVFGNAAAARRGPRHAHLGLLAADRAAERRPVGRPRRGRRDLRLGLRRRRQHRFDGADRDARLRGVRRLPRPADRPRRARGREPRHGLDRRRRGPAGRDHRRAAGRLALPPRDAGAAARLGPRRGRRRAERRRAALADRAPPRRTTSTSSRRTSRAPSRASRPPATTTPTPTTRSSSPRPTPRAWRTPGRS